MSKKALVGFVLLGLLTYFAASWKFINSTYPMTPPWTVSHLTGSSVPLMLTAAVETFALVMYLALKKIEPWIEQYARDYADLLKERAGAGGEE